VEYVRFVNDDAGNLKLDFLVDQAVSLMLKDVEDTYDIDSIKLVMFGNLPLGLSRLDKKTGSEQQVVYDNAFSQKLTPEEERLRNWPAFIMKTWRH
jgi:hypothetical protein